MRELSKEEMEMVSGGAPLPGAPTNFRESIKPIFEFVGEQIEAFFRHLVSGSGCRSFYLI
jgi:hypothetical protein